MLPQLFHYGRFSLATYGVMAAAGLIIGLWVIVYCARANRSALAADTMQVMGYTDVASLAGGWGEWMAADGPVEG